MTLFSNHSQLTANYIQPLLQAAEPRTRMCAANYLRKTGVTTVPVSLFSDPDPLVVRVAMAAAVRMRDRQAFPRLARGWSIERSTPTCESQSNGKWGRWVTNLILANPQRRWTFPPVAVA